MRRSLSTHYLHVFYLHRPDSRALVEERLEALVGDKRHSGGGGREKGKMLFDEKQLPGRRFSRKVDDAGDRHELVQS